VHQTDACQFCEAPALIGFGKPGPALTIIYWTCRRCKRNNVSAWSWTHRELAACHVMREGEAKVDQARARAAETLRRKARERARAR
jgi:hypothetical protein